MSKNKSIQADVDQFDFANKAYNKESIKRLSIAFKKAQPDFPSDDFENATISELSTLSLKERTALVSNNLADLLPIKTKARCLDIIQEATSNIVIDSKDPFSGMIFLAVSQLIPDHFCEHAILNDSFLALEKITEKFTSEFPIRRFIQEFPEESFKQLHLWAKSDNEHHRRLASEGLRPRLPWAGKLQSQIDNPQSSFDLLKNLMEDDSLYVRKSVANHLNDISKDNPDDLIQFLQTYKDTEVKETKWIINHALRSLIKEGKPEALALIGYRSSKDLKLKSFELSEKEISLGNAFDILLEIENQGTKANKILLDYIIWHQKANGKPSPKTFKWTSFEIGPKEKKSLSKKHLIKAITTRKYYEGEHKVQVSINGVRSELISFNLSI